MKEINERYRKNTIEKLQHQQKNKRAKEKVEIE